MHFDQLSKYVCTARTYKLYRVQIYMYHMELDVQHVVATQYMYTHHALDGINAI